jgi:hypothetical protein
MMVSMRVVSPASAESAESTASDTCATSPTCLTSPVSWVEETAETEAASAKRARLRNNMFCFYGIEKLCLIERVI